MPITRQTLAIQLYQIGAIQFGEFTLKSGQSSKIYIDLRRIISYPELLKSITDSMWQSIQKCQFSLICGVPYTALPIATCMSLQHDIPMIMRRKEKKDYGTKQLIEGVFKPKQTCLVIEDIITTGGSILTTIEDIEAADLVVTDVVVLINRQRQDAEFPKKYHLHAVFTLSEILQDLLTSVSLSSNEQEIIHSLIQENA